MIDGLKDAVVLRKFGGRCVLGFQSIAQVRSTCGDAEAQTIVENCGSILTLRCSASEHGGTAEFASRLVGSLRFHCTLSHEDVIEDAVLPSEIEQLPDLSGFLKLAPRPRWRRVKLSLQSDFLPAR